MLVNSIGNIFERYGYDAYGNVIEDVTYAGGYVDIENTRMYT